MLRLKFLAVLGIAATMAFANPVSAQSSRSVNGRGYTLSGDSLMGINQRTANQDFPIFFNTQPSITPVNSRRQNTENFRRTSTQPVKIDNTPVYLEPGEESLNGNDGFQLQFDLTNTDRR